ncbi:MAG: Hsp20/alpha crystallin family protein [Ardenticatenaceae bacterium]|nr:Hsp20/alpha crystallin family protein [Ardenticatenaceae bacterium]HBY96739.1 Hsp20/alpha crystallin family protein [Chloroflexota bacterium]
MSLTRWDPFSDLMSLREAMNRLFEESFTLAPRLVGEQRGFPIDMYEQDGNIIVEADMPGVAPEEVNIQVQGDQLLIKAESRREEEKAEQQFYRHERTVRRYTRMVPLPVPVKTDQAEASFENGTLKIRLPKSEQARARRIEVKGEQPMLAGETGETQGERQ